MNGEQMTEILSSDQNNFEATTYLTNPDFRDRSGNFVTKEYLSISRNVTIPGCVIESININNFNPFTVALDLTIELEADFADIFTVRGMTEPAGDRKMPVNYDGKSLLLSQKGRDGHTRQHECAVQRGPAKVDNRRCTFSIDLAPRCSHTVTITIYVRGQTPGDEFRQPFGTSIRSLLEEIKKSYLEETYHTRYFQTDNRLFNRILLRSLLDLRMMHMSNNGNTFYSAGVPWYDALFGRDSIIAAIQALPYHTDVARDTIRLLARYQGKRYDDWRDEEPGRILHELRVGEMANLNVIPQTPYYGSADSTPLFLILLTEYVNWTGDLGLFNELLSNVDAALGWLEKSDRTGSGFVSYEMKSKSGLYNQGWKDSSEAVMHSDGRLARSPIAMAEVQGYTYLAKNPAQPYLKKSTGKMMRAG